MPASEHKSPQEQKVFSTLKSDVGRGDFFSSIDSDFRETMEFLLTDERKERLAGMSPIKRWLLTGWWMLKAMFFKLTPARRLIFVVGVILILSSKSVGFSTSRIHVETNTNLAGVLCIILVLMLELKDKLVAKEELEAGRIVQDALKPDTSPNLPGWNLWLFTRSANEVGGDLVDFIKISDERVGIVLGDVAGKGLSAALVMVRLQATLRALAGEYSSLSELAVKLNEIFCRDCLRSFFASMVYLELDPHSGRARIVNAGHFPPLIVREGIIVKIEKGGAALGIIPNPVYAEQETILERGDLLCAYSDGVSEARDPAGGFFGEDRIQQILLANVGKPAETVGGMLVNSVDHFISGGKASDDLTLVLLGRSS